MNFYDLSCKLHIPVEKLYDLYQELFPTVKLYSYTNTLLKNEIEKLIKMVQNDNYYLITNKLYKDK